MPGWSHLVQLCAQQWTKHNKKLHCPAPETTTSRGGGACNGFSSFSCGCSNWDAYKISPMESPHPWYVRLTDCNIYIGKGLEERESKERWWANGLSIFVGKWMNMRTWASLWLISNQQAAAISCILFVCAHLSALESTLSKFYMFIHFFHCKWHHQSWNSTSSLSSNPSALSVRTAPDVSHMAMTMMTCDVWLDHRLSGLLTCALEL